jgi:membrane protein implicated in regulation of membrane protease activity
VVDGTATLFWIGGVCFVTGVGMIHLPSAAIVAGVILMAMGALATMNKLKKKSSDE